MISVDVACYVFACMQWWALSFLPRRACLAQARLTRFYVQTIARRLVFILSEAWSRLGENRLAWARICSDRCL